eukprot:NODE_3680_length_744_cov_82.464748_g3090_i0.p3 GENE.NODE_3680_length_744_cov_82.464748_g3090_i0~~NODE_3680_length_744_cov_82.464748_g3090_i0.p3  ORF type:complete len:70 (+),score=13.86 NODE_3680_length_744_cov_82.464748_g3090_i0:258-467(+)
MLLNLDMLLNLVMLLKPVMRLKCRLSQVMGLHQPDMLLHQLDMQLPQQVMLSQWVILLLDLRLHLTELL